MMYGYNMLRPDRVGFREELYENWSHFASNFKTPAAIIVAVIAMLANPYKAFAAYADDYGQGIGGLLGNNGKLEGIELATDSTAGSRFVTIIQRFFSLVMVLGIIGVVMGLVGAGYKAMVQQDNREAQSILVRALLGAIFVVAAYALSNYLQYVFGE